MQNEIKSSTSGVRSKHGWSLLALASIGSFSGVSFAMVTLAMNKLAMNDLEVILDGYAYAVNSDVSINLEPQTIVVDSELENCLRPNGQLPLNNASWTLTTNNQEIGIEHFRYAIESRLLFLSSETSNVVCDNGIFIDQIFVHGFESADTVFSQGFDQ